MVEAFVGLVGGGKSYNSVRRMMAYMARGGRVCANIRLTGWDDSANDLAFDSPVRDYLRSIGLEYQAKQFIYIPFDDMVKESKYNKGEIFEKLVTEQYGQEWEKDSVPFTKAGDIEINGIAYQIKYEAANFTTEKTLASLSK